MSLFLGFLAATVMTTSDVAPPIIEREFRAAWVATVANIDWPSKKGLSMQDSQRELIAIFDKAQKLNLNAIIFQVRPACDALYESSYEPWSEYITGKQGQDPGWDPLGFAIMQAHARGIELHAWFNPYRAWHPSAKSSPADNHITVTDKDLICSYGNNVWLDPGDAKVQEHTLNVILEVVKKYDIDGIHIDDYFYPYPIKGLDFPDERSYQTYRKGPGRLGRKEWRRRNVDDFVQKLYESIKAEKSWVKFGISPFGIYRPNIPEGIKSNIDQYDELYADAKKWLKNGWCDYMTPQLYWPIDKKEQSYRTLLDWWIEQNESNRHLWPGNFASRVIPGVGPWKPEEICEQIELTRETPGATGNVHFSMQAFMKNARGLADEVCIVYAQPALVPESPWIAGEKPPAPRLSSEPGGLSYFLKIESPSDQPVRWWVVGMYYNDRWNVSIRPGTTRQISWLLTNPPERVCVAAVDRGGRLGDWSYWNKVLPFMNGDDK